MAANCSFAGVSPFALAHVGRTLLRRAVRNRTARSERPSNPAVSFRSEIWWTVLILMDKRTYGRRTVITPFDGANGGWLVSRGRLISPTSMTVPLLSVTGAVRLPRRIGAVAGNERLSKL